MRKPEVWISMPNYEGHYEISNHGRVRSLDRITCDVNGRKHNRKGRILKHAFNEKGYIIFGLSVDATLKTITVHRIVAKLFVPNPDNLPEVNHLDGDKANPYFENLAWSSSGDNQRHAYKLGLREPMQGTKSPNSKLKEEDVRKIKQLRRDGFSHGAIQKQYSFVTLALIKTINAGRAWKHITL
jgi:hypothetical protein